jgi:hypothetical protein
MGSQFFLHVFVSICLYLRCIFDVFCMYLVCFVCISQNVSVSMRLATFRAKNTSKYKQYRQIHAHTEIKYIHNTCTNTYNINQLLCACMRMYMRVFACILSVCLYFFTIFGCIHVSECMSMYLYVSIHCHCSVFTSGYPWVVGLHWVSQVVEHTRRGNLFWNFVWKGHIQVVQRATAG